MQTEKLSCTPLQRRMIVAIARDELTPVNGAVPKTVEEATTFTDMVIEDQEDRGVLVSLSNADLVYVSGHGRDGVIGLTKRGFDLYLSLDDKP